MAVLEWPADICPSALTWRAESNSKTFRSPFNGASQTVRFPGTRWLCALTFTNLTDEKSRSIDALVASLDGEYGRVKIRDWGRRGRIPAGVPVVSDPDQTGVELHSKGWTPNALVLQTGDYLTVNNELKLVTADVSSNASGVAINVSIPQWGAGNWIFPNYYRPTGLWVFAIYGQPARGDWGAWVNQGGAFPAVVNSDAGMFLTQKMSISFTGSYPINCSENALVFCSCGDASIGLVFDRTDNTLKGYKPSGKTWGAQGGFSAPMNICVFDIKTPTIPDWGFLVYGADRKVSFTSAETPMIIREWASVPGYVGAMNGFSGVANGPMIMPTTVGVKTTNQSDIWKCNLATNGAGIGLGPGVQMVHVGSNILPNVEVIAMAGKSVPIIWGSDYF